MDKKVIIVGGVAGGASAAARLRRLDENAEIVLYERGSEISYANCGMPYYIGGTIGNRDNMLLQTPASLRARFNIDVRVRHEVEKVDPAAKTVVVHNLETDERWEEGYDSLILSPGAKPIQPAFDGSDSKRIFVLRSMEDCDRLKREIFNSDTERVLVVGGGFIGIEIAENLAHLGLQVTLAELADQIMTTLDKDMAEYLHAHIRDKGVRLELSKGLDHIEPKNDLSVTAYLTDGSAIETDMVVLAIGVVPDSSLAAGAGITLGVKGSIDVDSKMRTSEQDVFAVGDAVSVADFISGEKTVIPLAGPANRQGRIAASVIAGKDFSYQGTLGTSICKVFDLAAASTGKNERALKKAGVAYDKVYLHPASHATYYPGAQQMHLKLLFDPQTGHILGAQIVGQEGVDKRIDVIATAIYANLTVEDLENLELSYAPPFSAAKDPVNMAGFIAANVRRGDLKQFFAEELPNLDLETAYLLDVRTPEEVAAGSIPGAHNIPVDSIRERIGEIPKNKKIMVFCRVGLRGYVAYRILAQKGYDAYNLSGGYLSVHNS